MLNHDKICPVQDEEVELRREGRKVGMRAGKWRGEEIWREFLAAL